MDEAIRHLLTRAQDMSIYDMGGVLGWLPEDAARMIQIMAERGRTVLGVDVYEATSVLGEARFVESWDSTSVGRLQLWTRGTAEVYAREAVKFIESVTHRFGDTGTLLAVPTWKGEAPM